MAVIGLLLIPSPSGAQSAGVKKQQSADAIWLVPTENRGHFIGYYAAAHLDELSEGEFSYDSASVGKGHCTRKRMKNGVSTSCFFRAWAGGKASDTFTMDPLLRTAELRLEGKKATHHVTWTGDDLGTYGASEGCMNEDDEEPREGHGGGLFRLAKATGHVFKEHVVTKGEFSAYLMSGAMVTQCTEARALAGLRPGETLRITF